MLIFYFFKIGQLVQHLCNAQRQKQLYSRNCVLMNSTVHVSPVVQIYKKKNPIVLSLRYFLDSISINMRVKVQLMCMFCSDVKGVKYAKKRVKNREKPKSRLVLSSKNSYKNSFHLDLALCKNIGFPGLLFRHLLANKRIRGTKIPPF